MHAYACLLGVLSSVFAAPVFDQLLVAIIAVEFLPLMDAWHSGLIPYPMLLAIQLEISRELWIGHGAVSVPRPVLGQALATHVLLPEAGRF